MFTNLILRTDLTEAVPNIVIILVITLLIFKTILMCYSTLPNLSKKIFWSFNMSIDVAIVMGSASDWDVMSNAQKMLDQFGVKAEI